MKSENIFLAMVLATIIVLYLKRTAILESVSKLVGIVTRAQFIEHYKNAVQQAVKGTGLFPSVMMAQAILESSDASGNPGNSGLAKNHNNFFGIKASTGWTGDVATLRTREVVNGQDVYVDAKFRKYPSVMAGFKDRVKFLQQNSRYTKAGVFTAKTPEAQAIALKAAGYATDPNYATLLTNLINKNNLKEIDNV